MNPTDGLKKLVTPQFLLVTVSTFAYFTAVGAQQPTLPRFVEGPLSGGSVAVGLTVGIFSLSAVLLRPLVGRVGDQKGRRPLLISGAAIVAVSIGGLAIADALPLLLLLRFVGGIGEAAYYVGAASAINDLAPDERRGEAFSYFSLALFGGLAVGPILGEAALDAASYDVVWMLAAASAGAASLVGWMFVETRPAGPAVASGRLIHPAAIVPGATLAAAIWSLAAFATFVPLYALELGMSGSRYVFATYSVVVFAVRSVGARLPDRLGHARSARIALVGVAAGMALMAAWATPTGLYVATIVYSIGHSLAFPALMSLTISETPPHERAAAVSTFTAFFDLSFGIGALSAGGVAAALGYRGSFAAAAVVALAGFVVLARRRWVHERAASTAIASEATAGSR